MEAQQMYLNIIADNLANANTNGYKKTKTDFKDLMYQNQGLGADTGTGAVTPNGIQIGNGTRLVSTSKVFTQGQLTQTGEEMDFSIEGDGFFEVEMPDGTSCYTRDGSLRKNADGEVVTTQGFKLKSNFGTIPIDTIHVVMSETGLVTVQGPDGDTTFQIQLTRFGNPGGLQSMGNNLYAETSASGAPETGNPTENGFGRMHQGYLETSNVNIVQEMVNMIVAQRAYEINSKSIQSADEMLSKISQLKR